MKKNVMVIEINRPIDVVFQFAVNPENTPKWIKSVTEERTSDPSIGLGTLYFQKTLSSDSQVGETTFVVTGFILNRKLDFHLANAKYTCSYTFEPTEMGTRMSYSEEAGVDVELEDPLDYSALKRFKELLENEGQ